MPRGCREGEERVERGCGEDGERVQRGCREGKILTIFAETDSEGRTFVMKLSQESKNILLERDRS